ncbi:MAG TPA: hypothetical protein VH497_06820 [Vicinamibacterales bacterium]|jgi:hypothetical protein
MIAARATAAAAVILSLAMFAAGLHWGSTVGGGADSYGYLSQAGQWRQTLGAGLVIDEPIARESPWPLAIETWAPLGFLPAAGRRDAIAPLYSPGLPLVMAVFQSIGGFCAAFLVVPACGGLAIWLTFILARRVFGSAAIALSAAAFVATSPIFLYQLMNPMTDVPVTAAVALMLVLLIDSRAVGAGLAAAAVVLIRPNLLPVVVVPVVWLLATNGRVMRFVACVVPAIVAIAWINTRFYGAPWMSGYGSADALYAVSYAGTNVRQFSTWLFSTQTPFVLLGTVFFVAPALCRPSAIRYPRLLLGGSAAAIVVAYLFYLPFDAWWYLRFLLALWPVMMIATAAGVDAMTRRIHPWASAVALGISVVLVGVVGIATAAERSAFDIGRWERRYVDVARFFAGHSDAKAVAIALQHSGTLRMYAGRLTLRFDQLDPAWLDRAVQFLADNGRHPFIVLEDGEVEMFRKRFAAVSDTGRLDWTPMGAFETSRVVVYDAVARKADAQPLAIASTAARRTGWRCDEPYAGEPILLRLK